MFHPPPTTTNGNHHGNTYSQDPVQVIRNYFTAISLTINNTNFKKLHRSLGNHLALFEQLRLRRCHFPRRKIVLFR